MKTWPSDVLVGRVIQVNVSVFLFPKAVVPKANVTLNKFLRRFATIRCCHKNQCMNVTANDFLRILKRGNTLHVSDQSPKTRNRLREFLLSQPVFTTACYTGKIFNVTSLQILSLKIAQFDIT